MLVVLSPLHCVLASPVASNLIVLGAVGLVHSGRVGHQRVVRVGVAQQRADAQQDLADGQRRAPLVLENVQADAAIAAWKKVRKLLEQESSEMGKMKLSPADVGMVDLGGEAHSRRLFRKEKERC